MNNKEKFLSILGTYSKTPIEASSRLKEDIKLDSLGLVELIMECEDQFGIEIPEHRLHSVTTVEDILKLIDELVGSN